MVQLPMTQFPPSKTVTKIESPIALAKHTTGSTVLKNVQSGLPPAIPPRFRKPSQLPLETEKRFTRVASALVKTAQTTPPL